MLYRIPILNEWLRAHTQTAQTRRGARLVSELPLLAPILGARWNCTYQFSAVSKANLTSRGASGPKPSFTEPRRGAAFEKFTK